MKKLFLLLILALTITSCFSRKTNYYMLNYNATNSQVLCELPTNFLIQVGPVDILDYLKRDQIVIKEGENKVKISDRDLWITGLDNQVKSILKLGLSKYIKYENSQMESSVDVCEYPCSNISSDKDRIKIILNVNSFEYDENINKVTFNANAKLFFNKNFISSKTFSYTEPLDSASYDDITKHMSIILEELVYDASKMICENN